MLTTLVSIVAVIGLPTSLVTVVYQIRASVREAKTERRQQLNDAVKTATDPLREQLLQMTSDRDYQRKRADEAERRQREQ